MFNKTIIHQHTPSYPSHVSVTEKRAPTDESVKLLKEMEKKAEEKLLEACELKNNLFTCTWFTMREMFSIRVLIRMKINNVEMNIPVDLDGLDWMRFSLEEKAEKIKNECLKALMEESVKTLYKQDVVIRDLMR